MNEAGERAFAEAITAIEAVSSIEVVVAVRPHARKWLWPATVLGALVGGAMLAYTLFADLEFSLWQILVLPIAAGIGAGIVGGSLPVLYRALTPVRFLEQHVRVAARAAFVERGVHATRDRTGLLVFIALLEGRAELVGDVGVVTAVGNDRLAAWGDKLTAALSIGATATATELGKLAGELASALPRKSDDTNELPDTLDVTAPRGLRRSAR